MGNFIAYKISHPCGGLSCQFYYHATYFSYMQDGPAYNHLGYTQDCPVNSEKH